MADLDAELAARLSRLAAAVPAAPGQLDPVHRDAVQARQQVRMAWLTPLIVVAAVLVGVLVLDVRFGRGPGLQPSTGTTGGATATPRPSAGPTRGPENAGLESVAMSDNGRYWIEMRSDRRIYRESDPIDVHGTFKYLGDGPIDVQAFHPLVFSVAEPVHGIDLDGAVTLECGRDQLLPGQQIEAPFHKSGGISTLDPAFELKKAYLEDPVFKLPPGSWHIQVSGWLVEGECGMPVERFSTSIEITVLADVAERMDLLTVSDPDTFAQCRDRLTTGRLAREAGTGLGIEIEPGTVQKILWPYGYSAWDTPEGAILVNEAGRTIASEGQRMVIDGLDEPGWLIRAGCIRRSS